MINVININAQYLYKSYCCELCFICNVKLYWCIVPGGGCSTNGRGEGV
jgi:hypothetical protein